MGSNVALVQTRDWKRHRAVVNPAFEFAYIRGFTDVFNTVADKLIVELSKLRFMFMIGHNATLDCLGLTAFGFDFKSLRNPENEYAATYHRLMSEGGVFAPQRFIIPFGLAGLLPTSANRRVRHEIFLFWNSGLCLSSCCRSFDLHCLQDQGGVFGGFDSCRK